MIQVASTDPQPPRSCPGPVNWFQIFKFPQLIDVQILCIVTYLHGNLVWVHVLISRYRKTVVVIQFSHGIFLSIQWTILFKFIPGWFHLIPQADMHTSASIFFCAEITPLHWRACPWTGECQWVGELDRGHGDGLGARAPGAVIGAWTFEEAQ